MRIGTLIGTLLLACPMIAQHTTADQFNAWASLNVQLQVSERWWLVHEQQYRRSNGFADPMQTGFFLAAEHRQGRWAIQPGYSYWLNYPYGAFPTIAVQREHRFFMQAAYRQNVGGGALEHRVRLEDRLLERFTAMPDGPRSTGFQPVWRARYRAQLTWPLNTRRDRAGELTGVLSQEVMVRFGDPAFKGLLDQTRSIALLGWRCTNNIRALAGYQFQYLVRPNDRLRENDHTLMVGVQVRFPKAVATP